MYPRLLSLLLLMVISARAAEWYVSGTGSDAHDGRSPTSAFRTLQRAADLVEPGDTVWIGDGVYASAGSPDPEGTQHVGPNAALVRLHRSGTAEAWISWRAAPGAKPELRPTGWSGIVCTASYQIIDGLTIIGANDSLTLIEALEDAKQPRASARFNTNGIYVNGRLCPPDAKPHHVIVRKCTVGKMPGGGITAIEADYITIEDCLVFENGWYMRYAGSGITLLNNWRFDDAPGYHVVIQRNLVWDNKTLVPWERIGKLSDGNGILLDVTDTVASGATNPNADAAVTTAPAAEKPARPEWKGRALIANNVSAFNGGSGIHTFRTRHVDIVNNTTYWNGQVVNYQELFPNRSEDVVILNNIIVPRPGGKVTSNNRNREIRWDHNLYPIDQDVIRGPNDLVAEPRFVRVARDLREADFRLLPGSPGVNSGTDEVAQPTDAAGARRPLGGGRDRGAYER